MGQKKACLCFLKFLMTILQMNKQELNTDIKNKLENRQSLRENICKWYHWRGLNFQNIQTDNAAQLKENWQQIQIDISPKKTYRWLTGTWKEAQHC